MTTNRIFKATVIAAACAMLGHAGPASAADQKGTSTVKLAYAYGYKDNGSPDPAKNKACLETYKNLIGAPVKTDWSITNNAMVAVSTFQAVPVRMFPMGLSGQYAFMSDGIPPALKAKLPTLFRMTFALTLQFTAPQSTVMLSLEPGVNCVLSSSAKFEDTDKALLAPDAGPK